MTDFEERIQGRPGLPAPLVEGHADGAFLAAVAGQHVMLRNPGGIRGVCNSMRVMDQPPMDSNSMIPHLRSIVQRPGADLWTWEDPSAAVPMWAIRMISEAIGPDPDLRVLPDPTAPDGGILYRRVMPDHMVAAPPSRWAPIGPVRIAYGGTKAKEDQLDGDDSWMKDALLLAGQTIRRGCSFVCTDGEIRFEHDPDLRAWTRTDVRDGVTRSWLCATNDECRKPGFEGSDGREITPLRADEPMTYMVETGCTSVEALKLASGTRQIIADWTGGDPDSYNNALRLFAAPFIRSHPECAYVLQGVGGTGKSTLAKDFMAHLGNQAMTLSFDLLSQPTAMSAENAMGNLMSHLLALTDDYDPTHGRFEKSLQPLKTLLTGILPFSARRRGEDSVDGRPQAVHLITTNYHLPISSAESEQRRFAFATIVDNAQQDTLNDYRAFTRVHGFWPFMLASCQRWMRLGDKQCRAAAFIDLDSMTDMEVAAVREVLENGLAYPQPGIRVNWKNIGLVRTSTKRGSEDGRPRTAYRPARPGDGLYAVWKACAAAVAGIPADEPVIAPVPDRDLDVDTDGWAAMLAEARPHLFPCHERDDPHDPPKYRAKGPDGAAINRIIPGVWSWQQASKLPGVDLSKRLDPTLPCYGMSMDPHYAWIDLDRHAKDGMDGWTRLQSEVGSYGSPLLPRTYAVRTPSGGVHLLYRIPDGLPVKNKANADLQIDVRTGVEGYVVAGGSRITAGDYKPVDTPEGDSVPVIGARFADWLGRNGYVRGIRLEPDTPPAIGFGPEPVRTPRTRRPADPFAAFGLNGTPGNGGDGSPLSDFPAMGPNDTHDKLVSSAMRVAAIAAKYGKDRQWIRESYLNLRRMVPAEHMASDPDDYRNAVRSALEKNDLPGMEDIL